MGDCSCTAKYGLNADYVIALTHCLHMWDGNDVYFIVQRYVAEDKWDFQCSRTETVRAGMFCE